MFYLDRVQYMVDGRQGLQQVLGNITVTDLEGEILIEHTPPAPGVQYVGNGHPSAHAKTPEPSPMS